MDAMDNIDIDDNNSSDHHPPPVLFQSQDNDQVSPGDENDHFSSSLHPLCIDETSSRQKLDFDNHDHDIILDYHEVLKDDPPAHVHSQSCRDSCPVQDIYTESTFSRFIKGARTNLYGLAVVKELEHATPPPPSALRTPMFTEDPNYRCTSDIKGSNIFTPDGRIAYSHLPARYVLVAAGGSIKCFMGLQESFEFTLGPTPVEKDVDAETGTNAGVAGSGTESGVGVATGSENAQGATTPTSNNPSVINQEIISLDAFERKDGRGCQLVVVVSIAKGEDPTQFELRIYGANSFGNSIRDLLLRLPVTTDIQSIPLSWAPTKIIHTPMEVDPFEMAVLVAGSDSCVHYFIQEPSPTEIRTFRERSVAVDYSIFVSFPYCEYCVLSLVIKDYQTCRVVAAGTQNGTLNVSIIPRNPVTQQLDRSNAKNHTVVLFAPITTLSFFTSRVIPVRPKRPKNEQQQESKVEQKATEADGAMDASETYINSQNGSSEEGIHLLVTCAIEQVWVYSNVNKNGLYQRSDLAECSYHDSILTAYIMDSDWDGQNELLIGTYGRQLMVFKELPAGQTPFPPSANSNSSGHLQYYHLRQDYDYTLQQNSPSNISHLSQPYQPPHLSHLAASATASTTITQQSPIPQWSMTWNRRFATPVYGISSADLNDDGLEELVITTLNGVSIFLPDPVAAKRRLARAVDRMRDIEEMRIILEKLRKSNQQLFDKHLEKQNKKEENEHLEEEGKGKDGENDEEKEKEKEKEKEEEKEEEKVEEKVEEGGEEDKDKELGQGSSALEVMTMVSDKSKIEPIEEPAVVESKER